MFFPKQTAGATSVAQLMLSSLHHISLRGIRMHSRHWRKALEFLMPATGWCVDMSFHKGSLEASKTRSLTLDFPWDSP